MSEAGQSILKGAREALAYAKGEREGFATHVPEVIDVKAIRARLGLTQAEFAARFGFELAAIENWERGRRKPERPARILLRVIEREPEAVLRALNYGD
jgi:putative transcriptional regulator